MDTSESIIVAGKKYVMNTYGRLPLVLVKGQGCRVWDKEGQEYLDFVGGLAVTSMGHCHPKVVEAIQKQAENLLHCSNLYWIEAQVQLAKKLVELSVFDKVFFANSGAEANEGAIKLARKYAATKWALKGEGQGHPPYEIITMTKSFHGRTLATLTATAQEKFHQGFSPLPMGFKYSPFNDLAALEALIDHKTCAVMLEPIQGEGGVNMADPQFLKGVEQLCKERDIMLIFDEVQVGIGRTGTMFAYEQYDVSPDIVTLAKALGGGVPIGALMATDRVATAFVPGDHASTFGGNPLVSSAGVAMLQAIEEEGALINAAAMGQLAMDKLMNLQKEYPWIVDVRGKGVIIGIEVADRGPEIVAKCQEKGLLVNCAAGKVIRLLPPLNISIDDMNKGLNILGEVFAEM